MALVLDASAFAPLFLDDERNDILPNLEKVIAEGEIVVPAHWHVEIANSLRAALRHNRIDEHGRLAAIETIESLDTNIDATAAVLFSGVWPLAERHDLTIYDAAYLELAMRKGAALATHDRALIRASRSEGVELFGQ